MSTESLFHCKYDGDAIQELNSKLDQLTNIVGTLNNSGMAAFDTPGTYNWTVPENVTKIFVTACGGGGGGTAASANNNGGIGIGGGGGAAIVDKEFTVTPKDVLSITIGAGGNGAAPGTAVPGNTGGTTIIGSLVTLPGGGSGTGKNTSVASSGGVGGGSSGANGIIGVGGDLTIHSGGGSLGHGGVGHVRALSSNSQVAVCQGGGGSGGYGTVGMTSFRYAGRGGNGYCKIVW